MARPRKQVNAKMVERAASIGCTNPEIARLCECSEDTLERRFAGALKRGRERGKRSLRRMQWKNAKSGNVTMQIWLGKQLLGQADKHEHTGKDGGPIQTRNIDVTQLSDEELETLIRVRDRLRADRLVGGPSRN